MKKEPVPVGRPAVLRHTNALSVLELLRRFGSCSKADLVRASGLSAPTITNVVNDLIEEGLIESLGEGESSGGRPPDMIRFRSERGCVLAIDITADGISFLLTDLSAVLLANHRVSLTGRKTSPKAISVLIGNTAKQLLVKHKIKRKQLLAVVVGVPAITNVTDGIVLSISTLEQWRSVPLREMLNTIFKCRVIVENDTNLAAQGEHYRGAAQNEESFILITIGTGIGAGIVLNGKIYHGYQWSAGEIGYLRLPYTSRRRPTINELGELEAVLSSTGILESWKEIGRSDPHGNAGLGRNEVIAILDMAQDGNHHAEKIVQHRAGILTDMIINLSLILNPRLILLTGIVGSHQVMVSAVQKQLEECEFAVPEIKAGALGEIAVLWGGISLALEMIPSILFPIA